MNFRKNPIVRIAGRVYRKIPQINCLEGCFECCNKIWFSLPEFERIKDCKLSDHPDPEMCPFLEDGRCLEYEQRPYECRIFGCSEDKETGLACKFGCKPNYPLSIARVNRLNSSYRKEADLQRGIMIWDEENRLWVLTEATVVLSGHIKKLQTVENQEARA